MINSVIISRLNSQGMRIVSNTDQIPNEVQTNIENTTIYSYSVPLMYLKCNVNKLYLNTVLFTIVENVNERPTMYALHIVMDRMFINIEGIMKNIANQLQSLNIKEIDPLKIKNAIEKHEDHFIIQDKKVIIDWESDAIGGSEELW